MVYIFDFDGTLVDSMGTYCSTMLRVMNDNNIKYPSDIMKILTPLGYVGAARYIREKLDSTISETEFIRQVVAYNTIAYRDVIPAKPYVKEKLNKLRSQGDSLNVLTASPHPMLDPCLKRLELFDLFDNVWSCEDFGTTKSNPNIYIEAAKKIGVKVTDCIFIDDNLDAVTSAKKSGIITYGIYDESSSEYTEKIKAVVDKYLNDFSEL